MSLAALFGTFMGIKILAKFDEKLFQKIFKTVLFISAVRLIYKYVATLL